LRSYFPNGVLTVILLEHSSILNSKVLRIAYFANFQSLLENGLIFWGNYSHIGNIILLKKNNN